LAADRGTDPEAPRSAPADARCPRCDRAFHCGIDDDAPCACTTLRMSAVALRELRTRYSGCLCMPCLNELVRDEAAGQRPAEHRP
jgi:ribosomal protein L34E